MLVRVLSRVRTTVRQRWFLPLAVVLVVAFVALVSMMTSGDDSEDRGGGSAATSPPTSGALGFPTPDAAAVAADREYLQGDGRVLMVMHEHAVELGPDPEGAACREAAETLDGAAPADEVLARIGGLQDPVLRGALHAERTALGVALTSCITGEAGDGRAPDLAEAVEAVDVRLDEIGA